jgi:hypothetical protein
MTLFLSDRGPSLEITAQPAVASRTSVARACVQAEIVQRLGIKAGDRSLNLRGGHAQARAYILPFFDVRS